jgi:hypothetical protein
MPVPPSATARQSRNCSLCDVPYELGEVCQLVCAVIRKGGKLPVHARRIEGSVTPQTQQPAVLAWRQSRPR